VRRTGITVVVPPQAAERVPLSKSSAMRTGGGMRLVEMAVRVDATRRDRAAGRIDLARAVCQPQAELHDVAIADADVAVKDIAGRGGLRIADDKVEICHGCCLLLSGDSVE
jgi:hypothetical protein